MEHSEDVGGGDDYLCDHAQHDHRGERDDSLFDQGWDYQGENVEPGYGAATFAQITQFHKEIHAWTTQIQLQDDLVDHMRTRIGKQ